MSNHLFNPKPRSMKWFLLILFSVSIFSPRVSFAQEVWNDPTDSETINLYLPLITRQSTSPKWTLMIYLDGDNDLESNGVDSFLKMSSVGSSNEVNVLVQFDRIRLPLLDDTRYGDWTDTKRFRVTQGMTPIPANALQNMGEVNMGNPQTLIDFVQWGIANYPAEHYAVVLWDHGNGWKSNPTPQLFSVDLAADWSNGGDSLTMPELHNAFDALTDGGASPFDLIGFDACLMAMIEVDNQIAPYGLVRVGSEETIPRQGWPYNLFLAHLISNPSMSAVELGREIVQDYYNHYSSYTLATVDMGNPYINLNAAVDAFAQALIGGLNDYRNQISIARSNTLYFNKLLSLGDHSFLDLYDFAYQINQRISNASINATASAVMDAIDATIIHEQHGPLWSGAHGISIFFPASADDYDSRYDGIKNWLVFTANNHWDEWLRAYLSIPQ